MCMSDVCACNRPDRKECACKALSLYARSCYMMMEKQEKELQDWSIKEWRTTYTACCKLRHEVKNCPHIASTVIAN